MNDLNDLQKFLIVAQQMSFTKAAKTLGVSKSFVSRAIMNLEQRLGVRLLNRSTRNLVLTEAGETYLSYVRRAIDEIEAADAALSKLTTKPRGTLRVAMPVTLARSFVAPNLAHFLQTYPELRIEMTLMGGQMNPLVQRVDVAIQTSRPDSNSQLIQRRLASLNRGLYASAQYLKATSEIRSPQDLLQHSCLTLAPTGEGTNWLLRKDGASQEVRLRGKVVVGDPSVHHRLCLDGIGVSILPQWEVHVDVKNKKLVRVLPDWTPSPVELYALYPAQLSMMPKLLVFTKFMEKALAYQE